MINISQKDFNLDMEAYLKKRRPTEREAKRKKSPVEEEFSEEEQEFYSDKRGLLERFLDYLSGEETVPEPQETEEIEEEKEATENERKRGILDALRDWLTTESDDVEEIVEEKIEKFIDEDLKEVLKLQNKWLSQLSAKKIKEFKKSDDYKKIKEILKKYNLIKED